MSIPRCRESRLSNWSETRALRNKAHDICSIVFAGIVFNQEYYADIYDSGAVSSCLQHRAVLALRSFYLQNRLSLLALHAPDNMKPPRLLGHGAELSWKLTSAPNGPVLDKIYGIRLFPRHRENWVDKIKLPILAEPVDARYLVESTGPLGHTVDFYDISVPTASRQPWPLRYDPRRVSQGRCGVKSTLVKTR